MEFFLSLPPYGKQAGNVGQHYGVARVGSAFNPAAPSPPIPTHAPARTGVDVSSLAPAPILLWYYGPSAPKDLYKDTDGVGWCLDAHGYFWEVFPPAAWDAFGLPGFVTGAADNYKGDGGYLFQVRTGPPVSSGPSFLDQVGNFIVKDIAPLAIGILTIVDPAVGIAAAAVYKTVTQIAAGANLSESLWNALKDGARSQISSSYGQSLFDQGAAAAESWSALQDARKKLNASISGTIQDALGLKQAFEAGAALTQTKAIQKRAVDLMKTQLHIVPWGTKDWAYAHLNEVYDQAVSGGVTPTDLAAGIFPTQAIGFATLNNALAQATKEINPQAASAVATVPIPPLPPLAQSGQPTPSGGGGIASAEARIAKGDVAAPRAGKSTSSGTSPLVVGGLLLGAGYLLYKHHQHHLRR